MTVPFYSVIILTHNRSALLREAIDSVLSQTFNDFELIVIDDRSTDNTRSVVESIPDNRIKYYVNDRAKGQPGARNSGLSRSSGKWVTFLDDDDIWFPEKLEKQHRKIQEVDDNVGFIYTGYASYDFEQKKEQVVFVPEKEGWIQNDLLYKNYIGAICSVAIRRELFEQAGGFDERFQSMVDLDMWVRIAGLVRVAYVKEILVYIRKSNSDRISLNMERKLNGSLLFWNKYSALINSNPRLRHRAASRVFVFALQGGSIDNLLKALPWTLLGLFFDFSNFRWVTRYIFTYLGGVKRKPLSI